jgi:hypothetical protein
MFVDIDLPEPKPSGLWERLVGVKKEERERQANVFFESLKARLDDWVGRWSGWGWRVYRTAAGVRLLATHDAFMPDSPMCQAAFEVFEADPLYRKLCARQKCYRARLTPKPWRCNVDKLRVRWPWGNDVWETRFRKWEAAYSKGSATFATCKLVAQLGHSEIHPDLKSLVQIHDEFTRADSDLALA